MVVGENWLGYDKLTKVAEGLKDLDGDDHNIGFKLAEAGEVKVVYIAAEGENPEIFKLIGDFYVAPVVYTVVGVEPLVGYYWGDGLNATENEMTKQEDGTYKLVKEMVELAAGNYGYQVAQNHDWRHVDNSTLSITQDGKYDVTFTFNPATGATNAIADLKEAIVIIPTMKIAGTMTTPEWGDGAVTMTLADDEKSASYTFTLEAGDYEFKVIKGGNWVTKANAGAPYGLHRGWTGVGGVNSDVTENLKLTADIPGEYVFTWFFENDSIDITFPALPAVSYEVYGNFGEENAWVETTMTEENGIWSTVVEVAANSNYQFKIRRVQQHFETVYFGAQDAENEMKHGQSTDWTLTSENGGNDIHLTTTSAGNYTFTFNPDGNILSVEIPYVPTALDNVAGEENPVKIVRDNKVYIVKGDKIYNITGQLVR